MGEGFRVLLIAPHLHVYVVLKESNIVLLVPYFITNPVMSSVALCTVDSSETLIHKLNFRLAQTKVIISCSTA